LVAPGSGRGWRGRCRATGGAVGTMSPLLRGGCAPVVYSRRWCLQRPVSAVCRPVVLLVLAGLVFFNRCGYVFLGVVYLGLSVRSVTPPELEQGLAAPPPLTQFYLRFRAFQPQPFRAHLVGICHASSRHPIVLLSLSFVWTSAKRPQAPFYSLGASHPCPSHRFTKLRRLLPLLFLSASWYRFPPRVPRPVVSFSAAVLASYRRWIPHIVRPTSRPGWLSGLLLGLGFQRCSLPCQVRLQFVCAEWCLQVGGVGAGESCARPWPCGGDDVC
jgi:hypothetical protein